VIDMVSKTFFTPQGQVTRELTSEEIIKLADIGDSECKQDILKQDKGKAGTLQSRIEAIEKYLGV
jgi:hypothetical protein